MKRKYLKKVNKLLQKEIEKRGDLLFKFKLKLLIDEWGSYKKGDEEYFYIKLLDLDNGLARYSINKHWEILSFEIVKT